MTDRPHPCSCIAYPFPHRPGGGRCEGKPYICGYCHKTCNAITLDYGVGLNEYWGALSVHHDYHTVSDCCEATITPRDPNYALPS